MVTEATLNGTDLLTRLATRAQELGMACTGDQTTIKGSKETIRARWFLGGKKTVYKMSCRLSDTEHTARFREMVVDSAWGIASPSLTVETTTLQGTRLSGQRTDKSIGGGGSLDYAEVRNAIEQTVRDAGWRFEFEVGRAP